MTCHVCGGDEAKDRENARLKTELVQAFNEVSRLDALLLRYQDAVSKLEAYHASWEKAQSKDKT